MENASKALIIAGAVLITIVLISLGVMLISNSQDVSGQAGNTSKMMANQIDSGNNKINGTLNGLLNQ